MTVRVEESVWKALKHRLTDDDAKFQDTMDLFIRNYAAGDKVLKGLIESWRRMEKQESEGLAVAEPVELPHAITPRRAKVR